MNGPRPGPRVDDARPLNWRFVVPHVPTRSLLLPVDGEQIPGAVVPTPTRGGLDDALEGPVYAAVVAIDAGGWSSRLGLAPAELLGRLADAVEPGGSFCVGFSNPWFPGRPRRPGSLASGRAHEVLRRHGFEVERCYLAFPGVDCPAYLVDQDEPACLDYFVRRLSVPYAPGSGMSARLKQRMLGAMRRIAMAAPHRGRVRFAPGAVLVARRTR